MNFASLPVTVRPLPDEMLLGLHLRADEANALPAGTMARMTTRHDSGTWSFGRPALAVLGTTYDLDRAAVLLDVPLAGVESTTFRLELRRLFGDRVAARKLGVVGTLRICPVCVAPSGRLIRRETMLPLVHGCIRHRIWLRKACSCGQPLSTYSARPPFTCVSCGRDWSDLPRQPLGRHDELRQRRVVHAYRVILGQGDPDIVGLARRLFALESDGRWDHGWCLADDAALTTQAVAAKDVRSLAGIVANLVLRELPPERLFEEAVGRHDDLACRNRACSWFGSSVPIRVSAHRTNGTESYCAECGSRFLGDRITLSFDPGHGSPDLSPVAVAMMRARLADYAQRLAGAATFLSQQDGRVEVDHVFHHAGVPTSSHLRARRLGLVAIVARNLGSSLARPRGWEQRYDDAAFTDRWQFARTTKRPAISRSRRVAAAIRVQPHERT